MLDRRCLVEVPSAPRHRAERAHAEADYDEETARDNYFNPLPPCRACGSNLCLDGDLPCILPSPAPREL